MYEDGLNRQRACRGGYVPEFALIHRRDQNGAVGSDRQGFKKITFGKFGHNFQLCLFNRDHCASFLFVVGIAFGAGTLRLFTSCIDTSLLWLEWVATQSTRPIFRATHGRHAGVEAIKLPSAAPCGSEG